MPDDFESPPNALARAMSAPQGGRPACHVLAEDCLQLDVRDWHRAYALEPGDAGNWHLQRATTIAYRVEANVLWLSHALTGRLIQQQVGLSRTACNFGGTRPWFGCPHCDKRVAVLYLHRASGFGCRVCVSVTFASQREDKSARSWRAQSKIESRLGVHSARPLRMRLSTYTAMLLRLAKCEESRSSAMAEWVRRRQSRRSL
jgi:hypothetical protein